MALQFKDFYENKKMFSQSEALVFDMIILSNVISFPPFGIKGHFALYILDILSCTEDKEATCQFNGSHHFTYICNDYCCLEPLLLLFEMISRSYCKYHFCQIVVKRLDGVSCNERMQRIEGTLLSFIGAYHMARKL